MKNLIDKYKKPLYVLLFTFSIGLLAAPFTSNGQETIGDDVIVCHCNFWGKCKASGSRNRCAIGTPNVNCQNYNGNC